MTGVWDTWLPVPCETLDTWDTLVAVGSIGVVEFLKGYGAEVVYWLGMKGEAETWVSVVAEVSFAVSLLGRWSAELEYVVFSAAECDGTGPFGA